MLVLQPYRMVRSLVTEIYPSEFELIWRSCERCNQLHSWNIVLGAVFQYGVFDVSLVGLPIRS